MEDFYLQTENEKGQKNCDHPYFPFIHLKDELWKLS